MDQNWENDTKDFNRSNEHVVDKSASFIPTNKESYTWLERCIPYEGPHWFIRFSND